MVAEQVSDMFATNYPESHSDDDRIAHIQQRAGAIAIQALINEGRTLYVASFSPDNVAGFLESRVVDQPDGTYEHMTWLMTSAMYRGHGVASTLHENFMHDASLRAEQRSPKPTLALLNVNEKNPAKEIYTQWGYQALEQSEVGKIMMVKPLPSDRQQ
jgi:ribosomal protein S18 acetylase RimI-like enzyme